MTEQVTQMAPDWTYPPLEAGTGSALYLQLADRLRQAIRDGVFMPGDAIPSEHRLRAAFGVSRPTVRHAIDYLADDGLLVRRHGMGTFVAKLSIEQPMGRVIGFSERMRRNGMTPSNRVLEAVAMTAARLDPAAARALQLRDDAPVFRLSRVRFANDEPIVLETIHLPLEKFPGLENEDLATQSLYGLLLEKYGVEISYIRESLEPVILSAHEAGLLHTAAGTPGMLARIVTFDQDGTPLEHSLSLVRGDRCQYEISFSPRDLHQGGGWHIRQTQLEVEPS